MIDVSIVIVNWNAKQHLLNCLKSIYDNTGNDCTFEVVVVDNASTDGSVEVIQKQFPQVKLIENEENTGFAKANNIGINRSSGGYVCLVNSDVVFLDDKNVSAKGYEIADPVLGVNGEIENIARFIPVCRCESIVSVIPGPVAKDFCKTFIHNRCPYR